MVKEVKSTFGSSLKIELDLLGRFFVRRIPHLTGPLSRDGCLVIIRDPPQPSRRRGSEHLKDVVRWYPMDSCAVVDKTGSLENNLLI